MRNRAALLLAFGLVVAPTLLKATDHNVSVGPGTSFSPATVNISVGDRVIWTRLGGTHNVHADDDTWGNVASSSWTTFEHTFTSAGSFEYFCEVHSTANGNSMNGTVVVTGGGAPGTLQFSTGASSVGESAGSKTITVTRAGGDNGPVSVHFATSNGSATAGSDYTANSGDLNWADNDDNPKTFNVNITDDSAEEGNETILLTLSAPGGGATLGNPLTATLTINANDTPTGGPGTIRFTSATATVSEGQPSVTLTAERTGGSTGAVSAVVNTANGSATAGADYQAITNGALAWGNGDTANKTVVIPIVGDTTEEPSETFTATLSAPTGGASIGNIPTSTVTISDDDTTCEPCVADATTLCLAGGSGNPSRFRVRVTWTDFQDNTGPGFGIPYTNDSGFFYFFSPQNIELLIKIINACSVNDHFWLFNAAASNVGLSYEVRDTVACVDKTVINPRGTFASAGNIEFFHTCTP